MVNKRDMTKELLAEGLKELMNRVSFDKITIKMITDAAGVIRPTFYNHFQDKYEVLEYIFQKDVLDKVYPMMTAGMEREAAGLLFRLVAQDWTFYKRAFAVTGQNSFNSIVTQSLSAMLLKCIRTQKLKPIPGLEELQREKLRVRSDLGATPEDDLENVIVAGYYGISLANILEVWVLHGENRVSPEQMEAGYYYLVTHSFTDLLRR